MKFNLNYTYKEILTRKFQCTNLTTGETKTITITNRNNLSVEKQLDLLNRYDTDFYYYRIPNYQQE